MSDFLSFHLPDDFVKPYSKKKIVWGYPCGGNNALGEITYLTKYSRLKEDGTKERWHETCRRVIEGYYSILKDYCVYNKTPWNELKAQNSAKEAYTRMFEFKWLPPGRGLQFMGTEVVNKERNSATLFNCSFISSEKLSPRSPREATLPFVRLMEQSLCGIGVGFDVRGADKLTIHEPLDEKWIFVVPDTREGWSESVAHLLESYLFRARKSVSFDYSSIRQEGTPLKRFGGVAPGAGPLVSLHNSLEKLLGDRNGQKLAAMDILDIMNLIGKAVVSGGQRRSAELCLGELHDEAFLDAKNWEKNPDRMGENGWGNLSNNSVIANSTDDLSHLIDRISLNGEPGIFFIDIARTRGRLKDLPVPDANAQGLNPCVAKDTWVLTSEGARQVQDLLDKPFGAVVDGKVYNASGFWKTGTKPTLTIKFLDGRTIKLTKDHQVLSVPKITTKKRYEKWVPASSLNVGDRVVLHNHREFSWNGEGTLDEGYALGHLIGDGTFGQGKALFCTWEKDPGHEGPKAELFRIAMAAGARADFKGWSGPRGNGVSVLSTSNLTQIANHYGVRQYNKKITCTIETLSSQFYIGLLRGLFDTDGSVQGSHSKGISIRLSQSDLPLLEAVQRMLARLGINSHIYFRREAGKSRLPDGKGGYIDYPTKPQWELILAGSNLQEFCTRIGFFDSVKSHKLAQHLKNYKRKLNRERFVSQIESIDLSREEDVFDCNVSQINAFDANGIYVHNCGETVLESMELCDLVECFPYHHSTLDDFKVTIKHAYMYAKAVTLLPTPWEEVNEVTTRNRRIGASMSGIAQFAEKHGWSELRKWCDEGYKTICERDKYYSSWLGIRESIRKSAVKPSGSISIVCGATPGVHWPTASDYYIRRQRFTKNDPIVRVFEDAGYEIEADIMDPNYTVVVSFPTAGQRMRDADSVSIWEKTALAALMQEYWSDNSVSVTVTFKEEEKDQIAPVLRAFAGKLKSISFLPSKPGIYKQAPYEAITEEEHKKMTAKIKKLDMNALYSGKTVGQVTGDKFCTNDTCDISEVINVNR